MLSVVLVLSVLGIALLLPQHRSTGAQKRTGSELVPVRVPVQRFTVLRRRVR